ncbi:MAG: hypothetical protein ACR2OG_04835, partial [Gemmatimonadaceae bacterium]
MRTLVGAIVARRVAVDRPRSRRRRAVEGADAATDVGGRKLVPTIAGKSSPAVRAAGGNLQLV